MARARRPSLMRRLVPRFLTGLRARLVIAFVVVVSTALILVLATLPRLLDSYFESQSTADLGRRTNIVSILVINEIARYQSGATGASRPILQPTEPLTASDGLRAALGTADE